MTSEREASLEPRLVGDISGRFYVPAYQRGYRWGEVEVRRLLDDIWESRDKPYYLQPVVVKQHGDEWELVDGQQRLTTLFLIFQYMKREGFQSSGAAYSLRYETRPGSAAYLEQLDPGRSQENIDFFHIHEAYRCIREWFDAHGARRQYAANKFYDALFERVRVIWYEAADDLDSATLFTRLNVGRIPLTDAELVKALLLSRSRDVGVTDAHEIAAQWDAIERDLRDPELWAFITGRPSGIRRISASCLTRSRAGRRAVTGRCSTRSRLSESGSPPAPRGSGTRWLTCTRWSWAGTIAGIFSTRSASSSAQGGSFSGLIERSKASPSRRFEAELDELIRDNLNLSRRQACGTPLPKCEDSRVLLLMNVETIRSRKLSAERYSFREHAAGRWTLEHIHAQNAEQLNRAEQWKEWLRLHRKALTAFDDIDQSRRRPSWTGSTRCSRVRPHGSGFRPLERELTDCSPRERYERRR